MAGANRWMQHVKKGMEKKGTEGVFSGAAKKAGKSTSEFAKEHEHDSGKLGKRARLAEAFASARSHRK
jgi:hypothetical protein